MKNDTIKVALPKLFLWSEQTRYQEYPEALSRAEAGRIYTRQEIERELFDIGPTLTFKRNGKPRGRGTDGIVNAMGYERLGQRLCVNGLDFIRKTDTGFIISDSGMKLGRLYRKADDKRQWLNVLARQLLLREPRTRLLIGLILHGWVLKTAVSNNFPNGQMTLVSPNDEQLEITARGCLQFNTLLDAYGEMALGPLWIEELRSEGLSFPVQWCGVRVDLPSVNYISSALRKSLGLLFYIGVFQGDDDAWTLDQARVVSQLGPDVLGSFGIDEVSETMKPSRDEVFLNALADSADEEGYVIVRVLAEAFGKACHISSEQWEFALDQFVREAMYEGRLTIVASHTGQLRMGRGLFGDNNYRRIKIDFIPLKHKEVRYDDETLGR